MANWGKIGSRGHVEDRRAMAPAAMGGIGLTGLALLMLFNVLMGADPVDILRQLESIPIEQQAPQNTEQFEGQDSYETFASTVLGSNNDMWKNAFDRMEKQYTEPRLVLFRQATESGCGISTSQVGPHYCLMDKTVYLDETFFDELKRRFGATGGDVAEAYVIAHEVGHHAQNELGIMKEVQSAQQNNPDNANELSMKLELQADCFAGLWAQSIKDEEVLEPNEIREAMDAAAAVGDDRIQEKVTGQVNPETWTHGSSDERVKWFNKGYESGNLAQCNTFEE